jgi:hypothetical protein
VSKGLLIRLIAAPRIGDMMEGALATLAAILVKRLAEVGGQSGT